ncbi:MAG: NACHT domain-containing protein [Flavobacteriaceae bacterium]
MSKSWEIFENNVLELIKLQGWEVKPECLIGHKKVDIYAEKNGDFNKRVKVAIECKEYSKKLTRSQVITIFSDYLSLCESKKIDYLLLVTSYGIAPSALNFEDQTDKFIHITYNELLNSILDFSNYIQGLKGIFSENLLHKLYIPQYVENTDTLLEEYIKEWIHKYDSEPIAILGGYGLGKSSLAKRIAYLLSVDYLKSRTSRIPILIKLEHIATEQDLEGLLGTQFTSHSVVDNYNFRLFMKLNELGRFVFLLDGFDEMKKTMSWDSLNYNLGQLKRLVNKNSKVVLLGRPTAFLNDDEHKEALNGVRRILGIEKKIPNSPNFEELYIKAFNRNQVKQFILKYLEFKKDDKDSSKRNIEKYLEKIEKSEGKRLIDLASRPVQLKMLLEILPDYEGEINKLTVAVLYSEFIDLVIRREVAKSTREGFSLKDRRNFAMKLAYWMWKNEIGSEVDGTKIPDYIIEPFVKLNQDTEQVRRDLLQGCFLERKPPLGFYFPHRTFQEYLVAEQLFNFILSKDSEIENCPFLTPEIISFFVELIGQKQVVSWRKYLEKTDSSVNENCLELFDITCDHYKVQNSLKHKEIDLEISEKVSERKRRLLVDSIISKGKTEKLTKQKKEKKGQQKHWKIPRGRK